MELVYNISISSIILYEIYENLEDILNNSQVHFSMCLKIYVLIIHTAVIHKGVKNILYPCNQS